MMSTYVLLHGDADVTRSRRRRTHYATTMQLLPAVQRSRASTLLDRVLLRCLRQCRVEYRAQRRLVSRPRRDE